MIEKEGGKRKMALLWVSYTTTFVVIYLKIKHVKTYGSKNRRLFLDLALFGSIRPVRPRTQATSLQGTISIPFETRSL